MEYSKYIDRFNKSTYATSFGFSARSSETDIYFFSGNKYAATFRFYEYPNVVILIENIDVQSGYSGKKLAKEIVRQLALYAIEQGRHQLEIDLVRNDGLSF